MSSRPSQAQSMGGGLEQPPNYVAPHEAPFAPPIGTKLPPGTVKVNVSRYQAVHVHTNTV